MTQPSRKEALQWLVEYSKPLETIGRILRRFGWDSEDELVYIEAQHLQSVLASYIAGRISERQVEDWANLMEGRDDLGFSSESPEILEEVLHELANPALTQSLTRNRANELLGRLRD